MAGESGRNTHPKIRTAIAEVQSHWPWLALGPKCETAAPRHLAKIVVEYCGRPANRDRRGVKHSVVAEVCRTMRHIKSATRRTSPGAPRGIATKARKLLKTLYHVQDFAEYATLARRFAGEVQKFGKRSARLRPACSAKSVLLGPTESYGEVFLARVVSVAELMSVGTKLHQCVAHGDSAGREYHQRLRRGESEFWQLLGRRPLALLEVREEAPKRRLIVEVGTPDDDALDLPAAILRRALVELDACGDDDYVFQRVGAFWSLRHSPEPAASLVFGNTRHRVWRHPGEIVICTEAGESSTWSRFQRQPADGTPRRRLRGNASIDRTGAAKDGIPYEWVQWCWSPDALDVRCLLDLVLENPPLYQVLAASDRQTSRRPVPAPAESRSPRSGGSDHDPSPAHVPLHEEAKPGAADRGVIELRNGMTLGYEVRNGWWVGQLAERPEVISQGKTRGDLIEMILDPEELCSSVQRERLYGSPDSQSSGTRAEDRLGDRT